MYPITAVIILTYYLFFTWKSLVRYFDQDDMLNLYMGWSKPLGELVGSSFSFWNGLPRPLGALLYRLIFAVAGFHPLPFHVAVLVIGAVNLLLCFWLVRVISGSDRIAALACLLFAFHTSLAEVWFRTAVVYDVLCFAFVYLTLLLYVSARQRALKFSIGRIVAILSCFVCALDSKEMAVCVPVFIATYEAIFRWSERNQFLRSRAFLAIAAMGAMSIAYATGKLIGPNALASNPFYKPEYTFTRLTETWTVYLQDIFILPTPPTGWIFVTILLILLLTALVLRSGILTFAWVVIFFGLLPVSFSPPRDGFVLYISYPGWVLYAATLLIYAQNWVTRFRPRYRLVLACLVFVLVGWRWGKLNLHDQRAHPPTEIRYSANFVRSMATQMSSLHPSLPRGAQILFEEDAFSLGEWTPLFIMRLLYNDLNMGIDRQKLHSNKPTGWAQLTCPNPNRHDFVFTYENGFYLEISPSEINMREHLNRP